MEEDIREIAASVEDCAAQGPRVLGSAAATVPVFERDTEEPVLGQQQWEAVHERHSPVIPTDRLQSGADTQSSAPGATSTSASGQEQPLTRERQHMAASHDR